MDRPPITPEQNAAMLAEAQRRQAEFDRWAIGMLAGEIRLEGERQDAYRAGWRAGRVRLDWDARQVAVRPYLDNAYQLVAWCAGWGEGRAMPPATVERLDAARRRIAEVLTSSRARRGG